MKPVSMEPACWLGNSFIKFSLSGITCLKKKGYFVCIKAEFYCIVQIWNITGC